MPGKRLEALKAFLETGDAEKETLRAFVEKHFQLKLVTFEVVNPDQPAPYAGALVFTSVSEDEVMAAVGYLIGEGLHKALDTNTVELVELGDIDPPFTETMAYPKLIGVRLIVTPGAEEALSVCPTT